MENSQSNNNNKHHLSVSDYLAMENIASTKREYFQGDIFAMPQGMGMRYMLENAGTIINGKRTFTIAEYLEVDSTAITKNEYLGGQIIPLSTTALTHNVVQGNILFQIKKNNNSQVDGIYGKGTRVCVQSNNFFAYPDACIAIDKAGSPTKDNTNILNPTVIIEVTNDASESFDKGEKFNLYRSIPSLKEYIVICPEMRSIENFYYNENNRWQYAEYIDITSSLHLHSLQIDIPLADIFEGI